MKTKTAAQAHEEIAAEAERAKSQEIRAPKAWPVGKRVRQGDVEIHRVADDHPRGAVVRGPNARQLAPGITQGSRHVAEPPAVVHEGTTAPPGALPGARVLLGPCVVVPRGGAVVSHPEHAHVRLLEGTYQVTHQLDVQTMQRVQD